MSNHITPKIRERVFARDGHLCVDCRQSGPGLVVDHIIPWSANGRNDPDNLQTLCGPCHEIKTREDAAGNGIVAVLGGYPDPSFTPVPDKFFDRDLADLTGAEAKVMLYLFRRTFGFRRETDQISLTQISSGITRRDGSELDRGTGLARSSVILALKTLEQRGCIQVEREYSSNGGSSCNSYRIASASPRPDVDSGPKIGPITSPKIDRQSENRTFDGPKKLPLIVRKSNPQETVQETVQETDTKGGAFLCAPHPIDDAFMERMITKYGPDLGGESGVRESIADALCHRAASKWSDKQRYVQNWLKKELRFLPSPIRVKQGSSQKHITTQAEWEETARKYNKPEWTAPVAMGAD